MDFETLARWALPLQGESRASWLAATGRLQSIDSRDWSAWVQADVSEPERPRPGLHWRGLPEALGDIRYIQPSWRLHPTLRGVFCVQCSIEQEGASRWPVRVEWLDARQLVCDVHQRPLVYRPPEHGVDEGHARCMEHSEIRSLTSWLRAWRQLDMRRGCWTTESLWRRDLARMAVRNWGGFDSQSTAAVATWDLQLWGWEHQQRSPLLAPGLPPRLGMLPAAERTAALLIAHRCWRALRRVHDIEGQPRLPQVAWAWFLRRWLPRVPASQRKRMVSVAEFCSDAGRRRRGQRRERQRYWWR